MKSIDELDIFYQPPAEIRQHKDTCYTITPIGGAEELKKWREEQYVKLAAQKKAQMEAYTLKRSFLADISKGEAQASDEALRESPTLARFKQQYACPSKSTILHLAKNNDLGKKVVNDLSENEFQKLISDEPLKKQRWWKRIFKRGDIA